MGSVSRVFRVRSVEDLGIAFFVAFIINLVGAAVMLTMGMEDLAEQLSVLAYYLLVVGVALLIASLVKDGTRDEIGTDR